MLAFDNASCMFLGRLWCYIIIDREAREIIRLVTSVCPSGRPSVRPSVRLSVCLFVSLVLGLPSAAKSPMKPKSDTLTEQPQGGHLKERSSWLRFQNVCIFKMVAH